MSSLRPAGTRSSVTPVVAVVLGLWLALVFVLGAAGAFVRPPGQPPLPILLGFATPLIVFLVACWAFRGFRDFVLSVDPHLMTAIQGWRFAGFGFLALYAYGVLPGFFAWPAGLGDMAIGLTAPWVILALARRPGFAAGPVFVVWNLLGILDLVVAVSTGALGTLLAAAGAGEVTPTPMARLPLVLIPAYLVPVFIMLHLAALFQARQQAHARPGNVPGQGTAANRGPHVFSQELAAQAGGDGE